MADAAAEKRRKHALLHKNLWLIQSPIWLVLFVLAITLNLLAVPVPDWLRTAMDGPWVKALELLALGYIAYASIQAMAASWHAVMEGATPIDGDESAVKEAAS
jgi:hypothetical protein